MNPIGGYFELELKKGNNSYHSTALAFKSGRSSLHYVLDILKPALVYIPYYTCNGLLESFEASNTKYQFYKINQKLEPEELPELVANEYFLYINYFDVKRQFVKTLSNHYADKLIVDCTQAFFMKGNGSSWFFNSCRKYFGVPDGSYLYVPDHFNISEDAVFPGNEDYTVAHLIERFNGHAKAGYRMFLENEKLCGATIAGMSKLSAYLLSHINYDDVIIKRRSNFKYLDDVFAGQNLFSVDSVEQGVPMVYPLLQNNIIDRAVLASSDVFIPTFWADISEREKEGYDLENYLTSHLLPLPVDHRYGQEDMVMMTNLLKNLI